MHALHYIYSVSSTDLEFQKKAIPFLFFPNANLKPDSQKCIAFRQPQQPRPRARTKETHKRHELAQIILS